MPTAAKIYVFSIIGLGLLVLGAALGQGLPALSLQTALYLVVAVAASVLKLRLPGVDGAYSLGFLGRISARR